MHIGLSGIFRVSLLAIAVAATPGLACAGQFEDGQYYYAQGNYYDAWRLFQPLAEAGDAKAQYMLGYMFHAGQSTPRNDRGAAIWYKRAADQGYAPAQAALGDLYLHGVDVAHDEAEAMRLYRLAADQGDSTAQYFLAQAYKSGDGVAKNDEEAAKWMKLAQASGNADAVCDQAIAAKDGAAVEKINTVYCYEKAGNAGMAGAAELLGWAYMNGTGVAQSYSQSAAWFRKAAEAGDAVAQRALGNAYLSGDGVTPNSTEAAKWYQLAAVQGDRFAQVHLGALYLAGDGVPWDVMLATKWLGAGTKNGTDGTTDAMVFQAIQHFPPAVAEQDIVKGKAYLALNRYPEAIDSVRATLDPANRALPAVMRARGLVIQGMAYGKIGNFGYAIPILKEAMRLDPASSEAGDALAEVNMLAGQKAADYAYAAELERNRKAAEAAALSSSGSYGSGGYASGPSLSDTIIANEKARREANCARAAAGGVMTCQR